jgi:hypothetical protein
MDPDPDPILDPTPFLIDFKGCQKIFFFFIFLLIKFNFAGNVSDFSPLPEPDLDPDPGGPKICGSCRSGSPTPDFSALSVANLDKSAKFNSDAEQNYVQFLMTNCARFRYYKYNSETLQRTITRTKRGKVLLTKTAFFSS